MDGAEATAAILEKCPSARILILTTFVTSESIGKAPRSGATGAVQKNLSNVELLSAIRNVAAGKQVISSDIQETLTSDEIAKQYGITYDGVKSHLKVIFNKLGVTGRAEAISIALKKHLLKI